MGIHVFLKYICFGKKISMKLMAMRCVRILIVLLLFLAPTTIQSFAQQASARVSNSTVQVGQSFVLEYTIEGKFEKYEINKSLFKDFEILNGPFSSTMSSVVVNGRKLNHISKFSIQYEIAAKKAGNLNIPAINITNAKGGTVRSNTVSIKVVGAQAQEPNQKEPLQVYAEDLTADKIDQNLFIIAEVDKTNPYVGEQVNVTYKLFTILHMSMSPTSKPQLNGFWAYDEDIPENSEPHQENYKGRRYNVFILRKTALFPQQSGNLTIDPVKASGWVLVKEPDFWGSYQDVRVNKEVQSKPVSISVKALPAFDGHFSGGVGQLAIAQKLNKTNYTTDDLIQLTLTINGNGNLGLIAAPSIELPQGLSTIAPEIEDEVSEIMPKLLGYRQFTYNISAEAAGDYTIPPIAFSYYDDKEQRYQTLYTAPTTIHISEGKRSVADANATEDVSGLKDILPIKTKLPGFAAPTGFVLYEWYYWLLFLLPIIVVVFAVQNARKKKQNAQNSPDKMAANTVAAQRLAAARAALTSGQHTAFFEETSKAIWLYLSEQLNIPLSHLKKDSLQNALSEKAIDAALIQKTLNQIEACEMALYTPLHMQEQEQVLTNAENIIAQFETYFNPKK